LYTILLLEEEGVDVLSLQPRAQQD
jgi:hypothetical protein